MIRTSLLSLALFGCAGTPTSVVTSAQTATAAPSPETPVLDNLALTRLDGTPLDAEALSGKAVVFVNVASKCGYTRQYEALQALYSARKDEGVVVVGVPCNQFGGQESGTAEEIATFCKTTYGVTFPMLEKQDVNGDKRSELYKRLIGSGDDVAWNFEKVVIGRNGKVVQRFGSSTKPDSDDLKSAIDKALAAGG